MAPPPNKKPQGIASLAALYTTIISQVTLSLTIIFNGKSEKAGRIEGTKKTEKKFKKGVDRRYTPCYTVHVLKGNRKHAGEIERRFPLCERREQKMSLIEILTMLHLFAVVIFGIIEAMKKK